MSSLTLVFTVDNFFLIVQLSAAGKGDGMEISYPFCPPWQPGAPGSHQRCRALLLKYRASSRDSSTESALCSSHTNWNLDIPLLRRCQCHHPPAAAGQSASRGCCPLAVKPRWRSRRWPGPGRSRCCSSWRRRLLTDAFLTFGVFLYRTTWLLLWSRFSQVMLF